jgi:hypothetical protein
MPNIEGFSAKQEVNKYYSGKKNKLKKWPTNRNKAGSFQGKLVALVIL